MGNNKHIPNHQPGIVSLVFGIYIHLWLGRQFPVTSTEEAGLSVTLLFRSVFLDDRVSSKHGFRCTSDFSFNNAKPMMHPSPISASSAKSPVKRSQMGDFPLYPPQTMVSWWVNVEYEAGKGFEVCKLQFFLLHQWIGVPHDSE